MRKPGRLIDRDTEWTRLVGMWRSDTPELWVVRGRRRAGKSFLLTHFVEAARGLYYQATRRTEREQLGSLTRIVAERFDDAALRRATFESWDDLLAYCVERIGTEPFVLVLDEFPYLADAAPALPSILQTIWDHSLGGTRLKLVLSGSHITAMKRLTEADQPLFGRRTGLLQVDPLSCGEAAAFMPAYGAEDCIVAYGMFGGLPGHLTLIDPTEPLATNVARQILDPAARLHEEGARAFDSFLGDAAVHYSIIEAIAHGEVQWNKISNRVGRKSAALSRPLEWLKEMEVIEQVAPITQYPDPNPKAMIYRLRDPYLMFWHRFVAELRAQGIPNVLTAEEMWQAYIAPRLDDHIGRYIFEDVCRQFVAHARDSRLPFQPARVGSWWSTDGQDEIDIVAIGVRGDVLVGECKWGGAGRDDLARLQRRAERVIRELDGARAVSFALFVRGRIDAAVRKRVDAGEVLLFGPPDLVPPVA